MNKNYALVLGSGGANSSAYIGVCRHLEEIGILPRRTKHVVGCSGGAVVGLLVCCGYTWREMIGVCLDMEAALRYDCVLGAYNSMGIDSMDGIREVLGAMTPESNITLKRLHDLTGVRFTCYATNLCTRKLYAFDSVDTPDVLVVDAVCASMCVPFVFAPVVVDDAMFLDGAVLCALPPRPPGADIVISAKTIGPPPPALTVNMPSNAMDLAKQLVSIMVTLSNEATTNALTTNDDVKNAQPKTLFQIDIPVEDDGIFMAEGTFLSVDEDHIAKQIHKGYVKAREVVTNLA